MKLTCAAGVILGAAVSPAFAHHGHHHHPGHAHHALAGDKDVFQDIHHDLQPGKVHHSEPVKKVVHQMDHNSMMPHTHIAYHHVESACTKEVETLCGPETHIFGENQLMEHQQEPKSSGDPMLDWVMDPRAPIPPELEQMQNMMQDMINSFFSTPPNHFMTFYIMDEESGSKVVADSMATKLASQQTPEEIPTLVKELRRHGDEFMGQSAPGSFHHHLARRLSEMDTTHIQHQVHLPFGCKKNRCLLENLSQGKISEECGRAIESLQNTYTLELDIHHRQQIYMDMLWAYLLILLALMLLLARQFKIKRGERMLRIQVLRAVYSNPAIKSQVEEGLGHSIGNVPPLPHHVLRLMSAGGKDLRRRLKCLRKLHAVFCLGIATLVVVAPFYVLPICIAMSLLRIVYLCCLSPTAEDEDCECCCCGATTTDAATGNLTHAQECCSCCKGTGVCAPSCAACCGNGGCCCCCDGDCCCAMEGDCCEVANKCTQTTSTEECKGRGQKHRFASKYGVYQGVPVQVV